ncbi:MAG: hypothetical protein IJM31_02315 [Campylobacter sp.]|nr:hypothetical protein [Campylobacter sp.]MBQ7271932.1 hypothetical protein [Campylobacter sp.]MBQ9875904.1 hypothetical protein [Campylobacter sp.]MBR0072061.1 hypothetical protein [Campylobacter sp.]
MKEILISTLVAFASLSFANSGDEYCAEVGMDMKTRQLEVKYGKNIQSKPCQVAMNTNLMLSAKNSVVKDENSKIDLPYFKIYAENSGDSTSVWIKRNEDLFDTEKLKNFVMKILEKDTPKERLKSITNEQLEASAKQLKDYTNHLMEPLVGLERKMSVEEFNETYLNTLKKFQEAQIEDAQIAMAYTSFAVAISDFSAYYTANGKFDPDISKMTTTPTSLKLADNECIKYTVVNEYEIEIIVNKDDRLCKRLADMSTTSRTIKDSLILKKGGEKSDILAFIPKK